MTGSEVGVELIIVDAGPAEPVGHPHRAESASIVDAGPAEPVGHPHRAESASAAACDRRMVLIHEGDPGRLPHLVFPGSHPPMDHTVTDAVRERWNLRTSVMRPLWYSCIVLESGRSKPPPGLTWATAGEAMRLGEHRERVLAVLDDLDKPPPPLRPTWYLPGWLDRAGAWIDDALTATGVQRTGDLVQIKHWSQSAVLKVPTAAEDFYFKAVIDLIAGDPDLLAVLGARFGDRVPCVVASDETRTRWISRDFGGVSAWDLPGERHGCLTALAEMQIGFVDHVDALAASGRPSCACEDLAAAVDPLLAREDFWDDPSLPRALSGRERDQFLALGPRLVAECEKLDTNPFPPTLTHGDFEPLNAVLTPSGWLIHDWSYAAIAHPFFDLACWLSDCEEAEAAAATAHYLEAWRSFAPSSQLKRQWAAAKPVGGLSELLKFVALCDAIERDQWFSWTPMLYGWARRLIRLFETSGCRAGW